MKKLIAIFVCLIFAVSIFAACDNGEGSLDSSSEATRTSSKLSAGNQSGGSASSKESASSDTDDTSSKKVYVDAETDFTGQVTIVGRWHCVKSYETATGKTVDTSEEGEYYIFESTGTAESYYKDTLMMEYESYVFTPEKVTEKVKEGELVIKYGPTTITLGCIVEENRLTLYTNNSGNKNYQTVYERVPF